MNYKNRRRFSALMRLLVPNGAVLAALAIAGCRDEPPLGRALALLGSVGAGVAAPSLRIAIVRIE